MCAAAPSEAAALSVNTDVGLIVHMTEPELTYSVGRVHRCCRAPRARSAVHQERGKTEAAALLGQPAATRKSACQLAPQGLGGTCNLEDYSP